MFQQGSGQTGIRPLAGVRVLEVGGMGPTPFAEGRATWPATRARIAAVFRTRTRDEWTEVFADTDACVSPVLGLLEAGEHPHVRARGSLLDDDGFLQPAPAPRFDGVRTEPGGRPPEEGADTLAVLAEVGVDGTALVASGAAFTA
ncbi:CoA transferase [Nocardioides zeae]|nr:CoA transferase [Nocardioides zeae]